VIAIDDGSSDADARAVFDEMAELYAAKGWTFFRQSNNYVDRARNEAAGRADAEYLLMIDADDAFAPNAIERFLEAALLSGDDCLVSGSCVFTGDDFPYDPESGELVAPLHGYYMPIGPDVVGGMVEPNVFGGPAIFIRRRVFEQMGGYREVRGAIHEDWELHARLALAGHRVDVVPEYLHFYRKLPDGLARTGNEFLGKQRMSEAYDARLATVGMDGVARAMYALYRKKQDLQKKVRRLEEELRLARGEEGDERAG
jgi:glycosyltransferase involved in cell wall biosynthesis